MPPFIYTMLILTGFSWWGLIKIVTTLRPDTFFNIFLFLAIAWLTLTLTFSIPVYFWLYKKAQNFMKLKPLYRKGLKKSCLGSLLIVLILALKAFSLLTPLNILLLLVLTSTILLKTRKR